MSRRVRVWVHPSIDEKDNVSIGGWAVTEDSCVSLCYKNTELCITFGKDKILVNTYSVNPKNGNMSGTPMKEIALNYSKNKDKRDPPLEKEQKHIDIKGMSKENIPADFRHCIVFTTGKKKTAKRH